MDIERSPYEILGVPKDASAEAIKRAYRRRSSEAHPDRNQGDGRAMQEVNDAYALLSDAGRRRLYDETGETGQGQELEGIARGLLATELGKILDGEMWGDPAAQLLEAIARIETQAVQSYGNNVDALTTIRNRSKSFVVRSGAEDFLRPVFSRRIEEAEAAIKACEKLKAAAFAARELLGRYRFEDFLKARALPPRPSNAKWLP
jgi:curved DNA-binding protein CbpA